MSKIGKRITVSDSEIRVSSPKKFFMIIFMTIWLAGWTYVGAMIFWGVIAGRIKDIWFLVTWPCFWLLAELLALYVYLWALVGYELITVTPGIIIIKRSIFGYGPSKEYPIPKITNLRASGFSATIFTWNFSMAFWGLLGGTVSFDYEGESKRFGINLIENDAKQLVKTMKNDFGL